MAMVLGIDSIGEEAAEALRLIPTCSDGEVEAVAKAVVAVLLSVQREDAALGLPVLDALEVDLIKRLYSALACLFVEAAKSNVSAKAVAAFLCGTCGVAEAQAQVVAGVFGNGKEQLRAELARTGGHYSSIARLTGVDWRLQYRVASHNRDLLYHVVLKTTSGNNTFVCSVEQLHDLVSSLKDACKAVERSVHQG